MPHRPAFQLTAALVAQHSGAAFCLDERAVGRRFRLYSERPGPELNERIDRAAIRSDIVEPLGAVTESADVPAADAITIVRIDGPIEQRAGMHDPCGGWSDGHDAIAERMIAALETGDVMLIVDSPGGAHAGLQEAVRRVVEAKAEHGRRVTVYADEMIASAAFWWAACVGDEIYGPESMQIGSIGARSAHVSEAAHLDREGIAVTYFCAPGPGKVAFAPELPLSDLGRERGDRDVLIAFDAFANAVGPRRGMSREEIDGLNADVLSGQMAVAAKLADGVATLEEVIDYALALAGADSADSVETEEQGEAMDPKATAAHSHGPAVKSSVVSAADPEKDPKTPAEARNEDPPAEPEKKDPPKPGERAEGEPDGDEPEKKAPPAADKAECAKCAKANDQDAKYCDGCGEPMPGKEETSAEHDEPDGDEKDEADGPDGEPEKKPAERSEPPQPEKATVAALLGLRADASAPAVKSAVIAYVALGKAVMQTTGARSCDEARGKLQALADDAACSVNLRAEMKATRKRENYAQRLALLNKLAAANVAGYPRGDLFVDKMVGATRVTAPAQVYSEMKLATLKGLVESKLASGTPASVRDPFTPRAPTANAQAEALAATEIESPYIKELAGCTTANIEQLAKTAAALQIAALQGASS